MIVKWIIVLVLIGCMIWLLFRNRCQHQWRLVSNEKYGNIGFRERYRDIYECKNCGKVKYQ